MPEYKVVADSPQDEFGKLRTKVQLFGGGFGNGKTAAAVVQKVLKVAKDYPGANILVSRSTYPKLNDTIRKEFIKWCPKNWIKSFALSKSSDNTCLLTNGTTINFRYIAQQGKTVNEGEATTSNLLSATYDLVVTDQLEDPEITHKDFNDLLGRLRGNAKYAGTDRTMPLTGPRWFVATINPTRNWVFRKLVAPLQKYKATGFIDPDLLCNRYPRNHPKAGEPKLDENGKPQILLSIVEGSTYTNAHNLGEDFIELLESAYSGQSKDRYLYGEWAAYEGLVHPEFNEVTHCITQREMYDHFSKLLELGVIPRFIEGYDYGIVQPSCYLAAFVDRYRNVMIFDGFYKPANELPIDKQQKEIAAIRESIGIDPSHPILADPAIFRKTMPHRSEQAKSVAELFRMGIDGVSMRMAGAEKISGITKVNQYLAVSPHHRHPTLNTLEAPHLYIATELTYVISELTSYYWKTNTDGSRMDEPVDKNDHACNVIKYMLSKEPDLAMRQPKPREQPWLTTWGEREISSKKVNVRYG